MTLGLALLMLSVIGYNLSCVDLEMELGLSYEAVAQLQKEKEEAEEKNERVAADLEHKYIFC